MDIVTIKKIIQAALLGCTPDNSTVFRYAITPLTTNQPAIKIFYNSEKVAGKSFPKDDPAIYLALGCALYNIKACCKELSLEVSVDIATKENNSDLLAFISLSKLPPEKEEISSTIQVIKKRHTDRGAYHKKISEKDKKAIQDITTRSTRNSTLLFESKDKSSLIKLIQKASEIRFQVKEIHALLKNSLQFDNSQPDGLHINTLALPPGGKYFLKFISKWDNLALINKIGGYKLLAAQEIALLKNSPFLLILRGKGSQLDFISSGEELCHVWTSLNNAGYSVHPYYVIPDILHRLDMKTLPSKHHVQAEHLLFEGAALLEKDKEFVYMILRIGKTKKSANRSTRPDIESILSIEDH